MNVWRSWQRLFAVASLSVACIVGTGLASDDDEREEQKGKKDKGPQIVRVDLSQMPKDLAKQVKGYVVVQVDLSQMPKDLAKQVREYMVADEGPRGERKDEKGKGTKGEDKGKSQGKKDGERGKGKKDEDRGKGKDESRDKGGSASKIDERLEAVIEALEALRKELKRK
jgi:hypothetical protein